jgi:hypothetical protein
MNNVMQILAQMGSDASLQKEQAIEQLLTTVEVDAEQAQAIINKDITSLEHQLGVSSEIICAVAIADDEDDEQENTIENTTVINF